MRKKIIDLFELKKVNVKELKEWINNPRIHSEKGIKNVKESIKRMGLVSFLMVDKDMTIIGGHARKKALIELGYDEVKCWVAKKKLTERDFKVASLLSNKIYSKFKKDKINKDIATLDLIDLGFSESEVVFDDNLELADNELEDTLGKSVSYTLTLNFDTEEDRDKFEELLITLDEEYKNLETTGEKFIKYLKDNL